MTDHRFTREITCPYCNHELSDSWEYNDSTDEQQVECPECGDTFVLQVDIDVTYCTSEIECLYQSPISLPRNSLDLLLRACVDYLYPGAVIEKVTRKGTTVIGVMRTFNVEILP